MGMGIDVYGPRKTVLAVFPLAIAGALVTATAHDFGVLVLGQVFTGIGCAPAFLVCTVFIARQFPTGRFAAVNGSALGIGSVGLLLTGTPLAWVIEQFSWRWGFVALSALALLAWLSIFLFVRDEGGTAGKGQKLDVRAALRGYGELFRLPHTPGIFLLALTTYSSFMTLRGLWLGPMLIDRHAFSLLQTGNVAIAISVVGMFAAPLFGRLDPGESRRRSWIFVCVLANAACFAVMAFSPGAPVEIGVALLVALLSGFGSLQYADVRSAYPPHMTGRAMAVFTMALFLGVALMQWLTGGVASLAVPAHVEPYAAVLGAIALSLCLGCTAFRLLPAPARSGVTPPAKVAD